MDFLFSIAHVCRHIQVAAMMRKDQPHVKHQFDPWHVAKSVRKDLLAASKKRECGNLGPWISSIVNHLWWSASTCNSDPRLCQEKWKSILYHVAGIHEWPGYKCVYPKLQKKWVAKPIYEEKSYQFVKELMIDTILMKQGEIQVAPLQVPAIPANIAPVARGSKQDIISQHTSRFQ